MGYLLVFLGAGIGGALRHAVNRLSAAWLGLDFPWGTLIVNVAGGVAMGVLAGLFAERFAASQDMRLFLTTGLLGGFTTFSAFSLDAVALWERGEFGAAAGYVVASVLLSIGGLLAGLGGVRAVT